MDMQQLFGISYVIFSRGERCLSSGDLDPVMMGERDRIGEYRIAYGKYRGGLP